MGSGPGLVKARDWHAVLGIAWHWPQRFRLGRAHISAVATPMPVVPVDALQVEGAADVGGEDLVSSQVGRVLAQLGQIVCCHLVLDLVPALGTFTKRVGLYADYFDHVVA